MRPFKIGGGRWIRTIETNVTDLQSAPFGRSGIPPYSFLIIIQVFNYLFSCIILLELAIGIEPTTC